MLVEPTDPSPADGPDLSRRLARLGERAGVALGRRELEQLAIYLRTLKRWNHAINLTSLDLDALPDSALSRLVFEPLQAAAALGINHGTWYDFGSGSGSPALPLKLAVSGLSLTMVESRSRKVAFLRETVRLMELCDVDVWCGRVDELAGCRTPTTVDLITMRAIRVDAAVLRAIRHLLAPSGRVIAFGTAADHLCREGFTPTRIVDSVTILRRSVPRGTVAG